MDPHAAEMVAKIDYDFSRYEGAVASSVGVAIRSRYFDEITSDFIWKHSNPIIVNIGCGLDTRYHRLGDDITGNAVFYELDLPEAMELRANLLPPAHNDIYLKGSMFETDWMDRLKEAHPSANFLFVVEGVFMFFKKKQVKAVFVELAQRFPGSRILFDVTSTWMCKNTHRHDTIKFTKATFKLALDDDREIEMWADNLKLISVRRYCDFKEWRRSGFLRYWMMKIVPAFKNASRMLSYAVE
jgi:O-methyltransferase involved in polyketide biosynthesis